MAENVLVYHENIADEEETDDWGLDPDIGDDVAPGSRLDPDEFRRFLERRAGPDSD